MNSQTKYKDEIIKELQDIPDEDMPKLLEIIHCLKTIPFGTNIAYQFANGWYFWIQEKSVLKSTLYANELVFLPSNKFKQLDAKAKSVPNGIGLKTGMKENIKKVSIKKGKDPLFDLRNISIETGIKDLAEHHDHYLYGVSKW